MNYYKSCKTEHNISLECNTLRLGTLQDYREMNPSFSISDSHEGLTEIEIHAQELKIDSEQWNEIFGKSGFSIGKKMRSERAQTVNFDDKGSTIIQHEDYLTITGKPTISLTCLNSYMFCVSSSLVLPKTIDPKYDSQYYFTQPSINKFNQEISKLILAQFNTEWIDEGFEGELAKSELHCDVIFRGVNYVDDQKLILHDNEEFTIGLFEKTIFNGMFEKDRGRYSDDAEYRVLFPIQHQEYGIIPMKKDAIFLELNDSIRSLATNYIFE